MPKKSATKNQSQARATAPTIRKKETPKKKSAPRPSKRATVAPERSEKNSRALKTKEKPSRKSSSLSVEEKLNRKAASLRVEAKPSRRSSLSVEEKLNRKAASLRVEAKPSRGSSSFSVEEKLKQEDARRRAETRTAEDAQDKPEPAAAPEPAQDKPEPTAAAEPAQDKPEPAATVEPSPETPTGETKKKSAARKKERKSESHKPNAASEPNAPVLFSEDEIEPEMDFAEDLEERERAQETMDAKTPEQGDASEEGETEEEIPIELPKELEPKDEKPSSREEDYALIDIIRGGDRYKQEQAFKKLLSKYRGQIYNLILKIVHNPNEVEDLVQESFSKAFNSIANFNKEFAFSTWLYRIATNSSIDFLRKRRLKTFSIDSPIKTKDDEYTVEIPDSSDEPEKNVIQSQRDALVREAIRQLPPKYRRVIEMRHLQELSYEEIADELKIPLGTVKAHIFRAREMLYKMLRDKLRSY